MSTKHIIKFNDDTVNQYPISYIGRSRDREADVHNAAKGKSRLPELLRCPEDDAHPLCRHV